MKKKTRITQKGWGGLSYVEISGVPATVDLVYGELIEASDLQMMERRVAEEILLQHRPLCGKEIAFLRKTFGLSRRGFANEIGLSDVAVLKWERSPKKRLPITSEIAMRVFFAKKLQLPLEQIMEPLIFKDMKHSQKLQVQFKLKSIHSAAAA